MAGKHYNVGIASGYFNPALLNEPPVFPGSRTDRAYAEGRAAGLGGLGNGPHATDTPEYWAWENGCFFSTLANAKIQTGID
jgi:hypothetical protein